MFKQCIIMLTTVTVLTGCYPPAIKYTSDNPSINTGDSSYYTPNPDPVKYSINLDSDAFDIKSKGIKANTESLKKGTDKYLYFKSDNQIYYINTITNLLSFVEVSTFDKTTFDRSFINISDYEKKAEEKVNDFKESLPVKPGYLYAIKELFVKDDFTISFINKYLYMDTIKDNVVSFVVIDKECYGSSATCETMNNNMFYPISKPLKNESKNIDLKFNEILTLDGAKFNSYNQLCQPNSSGYASNFSFNKENDKIIIKNDFNWIEKGLESDICKDTSLIGIEFCDLGKLKLSEIKLVPTYGYKPRLNIEEGHSYAIKTYRGYVDFANRSINSYIYINKITTEEVSLSLFYNNSNKTDYMN